MKFRTNVVEHWSTVKMETLPEVLRVVISKALTSGKKLSWKRRAMSISLPVKNTFAA